MVSSDLRVGGCYGIFGLQYGLLQTGLSQVPGSGPLRLWNLGICLLCGGV